MNPFAKVVRDVRESLVYRDALLAQPSEFFRGFFGGRIPTLDEKLYYVEQAVQRLTSANTFQNDVYRVEMMSSPPFVHLDIRRLDGSPCKNWRDFQTIKNELVGPEFEAIELFPAESRLVDTANQYHLWVHTDPSYRFPVGFIERFVLENPLRYEAKPGQAAPVPVAADSVATRVPVTVSPIPLPRSSPAQNESRRPISSFAAPCQVLGTTLG